MGRLSRILKTSVLGTCLALSSGSLPAALSPQSSVLSTPSAWAGELRSADLVRYIRDLVQVRYQVPGRDISVIWKDGEPAAKVGSLLEGDNKITYRIQDDVQSSLLGREV